MPPSPRPPAGQRVRPAPTLPDARERGEDSAPFEADGTPVVEDALATSDALDDDDVVSADGAEPIELVPLELAEPYELPALDEGAAGAVLQGLDDGPAARDGLPTEAIDGSGGTGGGPADSVTTQIRKPLPTVARRRRSPSLPSVPVAARASVAAPLSAGSGVDGTQVYVVGDEDVWEEQVLFPPELPSPQAPPRRPPVLRPAARTLVDAAAEAFARTDAPRTIDADTAALEAKYQADGHWESLIDLYLRRLEKTADGYERGALFKRIAGAFRDGVRDPSSAYYALLEAFRHDPFDDDTRIALEEHARRLERWEETLVALAEHLGSDGDPVQLARICEVAIGWTRQELHDSSLGARFVDQLGRLDPSHPAVHRRLASVYRDKGAWDAQRDALERALLRAEGADEQRAIHAALAQLFEGELRNFSAATRHWDAILAVDPDDMEALSGLERIARAEQRYSKLVLILERQIEAAPTRDDKAQAHLKLAELFEHQLLKPAQAVAHFEKAAELSQDPRKALAGLERGFVRLRDWNKLAEVFEAQAKAEDETTARIACLLRLAQLHEDKRQDAEAARGAYRKVVALDPTHTDAISSLARIAERAGSWDDAANYRQKLAERAKSPEAAAQAHIGIGDMLARHDSARARLHYERAAQLDPKALLAWEALERLAIADGDRAKAAQYMAQRARHAPSPRARAQGFTEVGRFLERELGDGASAFEAYEQALDADPAYEPAARAIVDELARREQWERVGIIAEPLAAASLREGDARRAFDLLALAAKSAISRGDGARALACALKALEIRPGDSAVQRAVIDICEGLKDQPEAVRPARDVMLRMATQGSDLGADGLVRLAALCRAVGEGATALQAYHHALGIEPAHGPALDGLAALYIERGDHSRAAQTKLLQSREEADAERRYTLLVECAELWAHKVRNLDKATAAFEEARALKPHDPWLLHTLLKVYGERQDWQKLEETLRTLAEVEPSADERVKARFALAQFYATQLGDADRAVTVLEAVLDADPQRFAAFDRIVVLLSERKNWQGLARAYQAMILRVHQGQFERASDIRYALYHQLGVLSRDKLGHKTRALEAFAAASRERPDSDIDRRYMAELQLAMNQLESATATTRARIVQNPLAPEPYRELADLLFRQKAYDRALCAVDVLAHLGAADAEQSEFLRGYPPPSLEEVPGSLASEAWASHVLHPELDPALTALLRVLTAAVRRARAAAFTDEQKERLGTLLLPGSSDLGDFVYAAFQNASEILGMCAPLLFRRDELPTPISPTLAHAPACWVSLEALQSCSDATIRFLVAKALSELRPELATRAFFPSVAEVTQLLTVAARIAPTTVPRGLSAVESAVLAALGVGEHDALRRALGALGSGARVDVAKWLAFADVSSSRAALLLAGSVEPAWKGLLASATSAGDLPATKRRGELLQFAVSESYAELREALGVAIEL